MKLLKKIFLFKNYESGVDKFISLKDREIFSDSQLKERNKHKRLFFYRDHTVSNKTEKSIWEKF